MDFEELYREYFNDVYRYILKLSSSHHIAEEITSDTFFKAMRSIDSFRGDCDIRVWLCQIAKNCYYSYLKKQKKNASLEDYTPDECESIEESVADEYDAKRIKKALHEIEEPYKEVFMWRVFADMSFKQIGQIFGKTENWACVTYHRAKTKILKKLEDENNG